MVLGLAKKFRDDERLAMSKRGVGMLVGMLRREFAQKGRNHGNRQGRGKGKGRKKGKAPVVAKAKREGKVKK